VGQWCRCNSLGTSQHFRVCKYCTYIQYGPRSGTVATAGPARPRWARLAAASKRQGVGEVWETPTQSSQTIDFYRHVAEKEGFEPSIRY
jgi:hypothetical protein